MLAKLVMNFFYYQSWLAAMYFAMNYTRRGGLTYSLAVYTFMAYIAVAWRPTGLQ